MPHEKPTEAANPNGKDKVDRMEDKALVNPPISVAAGDQFKDKKNKK